MGSQPNLHAGEEVVYTGGLYWSNADNNRANTPGVPPWYSLGSAGPQICRFTVSGSPDDLPDDSITTYAGSPIVTSAAGSTPFTPAMIAGGVPININGNWFRIVSAAATVAVNCSSPSILCQWLSASPGIRQAEIR